jgi:hypothetical protein
LNGPETVVSGHQSGQEYIILQNNQNVSNSPNLQRSFEKYRLKTQFTETIEGLKMR